MNKFESFLVTAGKDFMKGLAFVVKDAPAVASLVSLIFPATAAVDAGVVTATSLIQNAVLLVEQKYAASGVQTGTGEQKLAEVLLLAGPAVTSLLAKAGITATAPYLTSLIKAVVAILNVQNPAVTPAVPVAA